MNVFRVCGANYCSICVQIEFENILSNIICYVMHSNEIPNENTVADTNRKKTKSLSTTTQILPPVNLLKYYCFNAKRTRQI